MGMNTYVQEIQSVDANGAAVSDSAGNPAVNTLQANVPAFPSQQYVSAVSVAGTADNDVLYTSADVSAYNYHVFDNRSGETIDIWVSVDGTNFSQTAAAVDLINDVTTGGGLRHIDIATTETGILRGKFKNVRVIQKGAGAPAAGEILIGHGVE